MLPIKIGTRLNSSPIRELLFGWLCHFGLKNVPPTYQRAMSITFKDYLGVFMKLFLDDFDMFSDLDNHLLKLRLCFDKCREFNISLNLKKWMFLVHSCVILGYVVAKEGKLLDSKKISTIIHMPTPKNLRTFMFSMAWHNITSVSSKKLLSLWFPLLSYSKR